MTDGDIKALQGQIDSLKAELALRSESAEKLNNSKIEAMDKRLSWQIKLFNVVYIALAGVIAVITIFLTVFSVGYIKKTAKFYAEKNAKEAVQILVDKHDKDLDERIVEIENRIEFDYWYKIGEKEFEYGDLASAIKSFTRAIEKKPNHVYAVGVRGIAYARLGKMKKAIVDLDKAIDIKEDYAVAYGYKGMAHFYLREYVTAFNAYHKEVDLLIRMGDLESASGEISMMSSYFEKAKVDEQFDKEMQKSIAGDIEQLKNQLEEAREKGKETMK